MRESTSASHACGSTPFIFAVTMRLYMAAARWPPRSDPQNNHFDGSALDANASFYSRLRACELPDRIRSLSDACRQLDFDDPLAS